MPIIVSLHPIDMIERIFNFYESLTTCVNQLFISIHSWHQAGSLFDTILVMSRHAWLSLLEVTGYICCFYGSLLNTMGGALSVSACVRGWRGSNFGVGSVGGAESKKFGVSGVGGVGP